MTNHISVTRDGAVQVLRFDRVEKKNAITDAMYHALADALEEGERDAAVRAHLLLGKEGVFTAGNDVADFVRLAQSGEALNAGVGRYLAVQTRIEKPLLAAVDGLAIGIGTTLLFHCDMVFATERSQFATPFVDLGLVPENASSLLAPLLMGPQRAFEMLALGERFSAERAVECGFVNRILPVEELEPHALDIATRLAAKPPEALRLAKSLMRTNRDAIEAASKREAKIFAERLTAAETQQAFAAFLSR